MAKKGLGKKVFVIRPYQADYYIDVNALPRQRKLKLEGERQIEDMLYCSY